MLIWVSECWFLFQKEKYIVRAQFPSLFGKCECNFITAVKDELCSGKLEIGNGWEALVFVLL